LFRVLMLSDFTSIPSGKQQVLMSGFINNIGSLKIG
jgi:hypothetical protein